MITDIRDSDCNATSPFSWTDFPDPHHQERLQESVDMSESIHTASFITGKSLCERWQLPARDFEMLVMNGRLRAHDAFGDPVDICSVEELLERLGALQSDIAVMKYMNSLLAAFESYRYPMEDVRALEKACPSLIVQSVAMPTAESLPEPMNEPPGRKRTQLTNQAKSRLNEISPAITGFYERLKALIKDEHRTLVNAGADDWEAQALSLLEINGTWKEIIVEADIQKISFAKLAKSEHKERLKTELAQIILERKGCQRINRKALKGCFK